MPSVQLHYYWTSKHCQSDSRLLFPNECKLIKLLPLWNSCLVYTWFTNRLNYKPTVLFSDILSIFFTFLRKDQGVGFYWDLFRLVEQSTDLNFIWPIFMLVLFIFCLLRTSEKANTKLMVLVFQESPNKMRWLIWFHQLFYLYSRRESKPFK